MKKFLFLIIAGILVVSCKKKYNCRCSTTVIYPNYSQGLYTSKSKPMSEKMTKKQAKAVCDHEAESIEKTYYNAITNSGNFSSNGISATTHCVLE